MNAKRINVSLSEEQIEKARRLSIDILGSNNLSGLIGFMIELVDKNTETLLMLPRDIAPNQPIKPSETLKSKPAAKVEPKETIVSELLDENNPVLKPFEQVSRNLNGKRAPLVRTINRGIPTPERKTELDPEAIANMVKSNIKAKTVNEAPEPESTKETQPRRKTLDELGVKTVTGRKASEVIK